MKLPLDWLNDFVKINLPDRELAEGFSMSGSKVETIEDERGTFSGVVVGKILSVGPHPDADKLKVCKVQVAEDKILTICTAAPNVREGAFVPVCTDGAVLPDGKKIKAGKMRGVPSEGMMCGFDELGLTQNDAPDGDPDGLYFLTDECYIGQDAHDALKINDRVIDFEITNNRPDCLSVRGLAREAAAAFGGELTLPVPKVKAAGERVKISVAVENPELCPRYCARVVRNVRVEPSPPWLRARLRAAGMRPINNIVDITNYVCLEYGQPMHAFDYACLDGGRIVVRTAREGETIQTLDGNERKLDASMLMICDESKPVCVAGVMGGLNSEITGNTRDVVFESATFGGASVRRTALELNMRTDASSRFEKGLDAENAIPALERACELVEMLNAGEVAPEIADFYHAPFVPRTIGFNPERINAFLGADIPAEVQAGYLKKLGFAVAGSVVSVPSWRPDVNIWQDLAEEAARLYGYDKIPPRRAASTQIGGLTERQKLMNDAGRVCRENGFDEILTYSFISPGEHALFGEGEREKVTIQNPLGEDRSEMRRTALPSLFGALAKNFAAGAEEAWLYEIAQTFIPNGGELPEERPVITLGAYGGGIDFYAMKAAAEELLKQFNIKDAVFSAKKDAFAYHPGRTCAVSADGAELGIFGEISPKIAAAYGIAGRVYALEFEFGALYAARGAESKYKALPVYPPIRRDIAAAVDINVTAGEMLEAIKQRGGKLLESAEVFDVYDKLGGGKKSVAYRLVYRAPDRTLTDGEADKKTDAIVRELAERFGAERR